jgi:hypothetical protein
MAVPVCRCGEYRLLTAGKRKGKPEYQQNRKQQVPEKSAPVPNEFHGSGFHHGVE